MAPSLTMTMTDERRNLPRRPIKGHAMAVFSTGPMTTRISRVELVDASWTGIGLKTAEPIDLGVSVALTPEDAMWPRQTGIVVRCEQLADGSYHLGLLSRRAKSAVA